MIPASVPWIIVGECDRSLADVWLEAISCLGYARARRPRHHCPLCIGCPISCHTHLIVILPEVPTLHCARQAVPDYSAGMLL